MIARIWRGQANTGSDADGYFRHATETVFPSLERLAGHRGAYLLRREVGERTEFLAVTLWKSRKAIEAFAGHDIDKANVEPEARTLLVDYDELAHHYEVAFQKCS